MRLCIWWDESDATSRCQPAHHLPISLELIRPELRLELRSALYQAVQQQTNVDASNLPITIDSRTETVTIHVRPVLRHGDPAHGFLLVLFAPGTERPHDATMAVHAQDAVTHQLEVEVERVRLQLRTSSEQYEVQTEELKASNEELHALNEELRSSNEELETSKEELQSLNEELHTVNQELKVKIEEATQSNTNLQNLVNATDIATIFLDTSSRIRLFTPAAHALFNLIATDYGRPLAHITHRLRDADLMGEAARVFATLQTVEREVRTTDDRMFLMRVLPYRVGGDRIGGVVLTFVDITARQRAEAALRESQERLRLALGAANMGTFMYHIAEDRGEPDARMLALFGLPADGTLNMAVALATLIHPDDRAHYAEDVARATDPAGAGMMQSDIRVLQPDGSLCWVSVTAQVLFEEQPRRATLMYGVAADITERKQAEERQVFLLKLSDALRPVASPVDIEAAVTRLALEYFAADRCYYCTIEDGNAIVRKDAVRGDLPSVAGIYPLHDFAIFRSAIDAGKPYAVPDVHTTDKLDEGLRQICLQLGIISNIIVPVIKQGAAVGLFCLVQSTPREWTTLETDLAAEIAERTWAAVERARAEAALRASEQRLQHMVNVPRVGVLTFDYTGKMIHANDAFLDLVGYTRDEFAARAWTWRDFTPPEYTEASERVIEDLLERMRSGPYEKEYFRKDGSRIWLMFVAANLGDGTIVEYAVDISDRKRAEKALHESEERQAFLLRLNDMLRPLADPAQIQTVASRLLVEHLGATRAMYLEIEGSGDAAEAVIHGQYARGVSLFPSRVPYVDFAKGLPSETLQRSDTLVVTDTAADPRIADDVRAAWLATDVAAAIAVSLVKQGQMVANFGLHNAVPHEWTPLEIQLVEEVADRTWAAVERTRAEEALRESEQRLRALVENLPGGAVFIVDRELRYVLAEGEALQLAGFTPDHFVKKTLSEALEPELAARHQAHYQRALAGEPFVVEHDERGRSYITSGTPLRSASGEVYAVLAISYDITARKQAEVAVRESEERFRLLVEGARDYAMFLLDSDSRITFWSLGAERVFGYTEAEALGQSGGIIFTPEDRARGAVEHEVRTAVIQGRAEDRRWHVRKDGTRVFLDGLLVRLDDEQNALRGFVKIGRDATVQREAEEALQHAHDQLELRVAARTAELAAANDLLHLESEERRQLAAQRAVLLELLLTAQEDERQRIAHELHDSLGQFLSAVGLRLSLVQARDDLPPLVRDELAQLRALTLRVDQEVDRLTFELRPLVLEHLGLVEALQSYAADWTVSSGIAVEVVVAGLSAARLAVEIEITTYRIVQEALTNVLKHAQATAVSVIIERHRDGLRVIIEDNGRGFDLSQRTAQGAGGRQVGLIGMAERAALVGGRLTIETAPGSGTTIYLYIPLEEDAAERAENTRA